MHSKDTKILDVSTSGIKTKLTLIEPGVTELDNIQNTIKYMDRNSKIHIHEIDFVVSGAAVITLYLGDESIWERTLTAAGEIHALDRDIYVASNVLRILSISVSTNVTVVGRIFFSYEYTGGKMVKETANRS